MGRASAAVGARLRTSRLARPGVRRLLDPAARRRARLERDITWIWGTPRGGSTWLLQLLTQPLDPDPEAVLGFTVPRTRPPRHLDAVPIDESFLSNHIAPALADPRRHADRWVPGTINNLLAGRPAYALSNAYRQVWEPAVGELALKRVGAVLDRARREGVPLAAHPQVVIKETNGSHAADLVMRVLPESRSLLLVRDPRDVADSMLAAYKPGAFFAVSHEISFESPEQRASGVEWAAKLWACNIDVALRAAEALPASRSRVVRYEDLLADTRAELSELFTWLGLSRDPGWIDRAVAARDFAAIPPEQKGPLTRNRAATPGLWRENLSESERATVEEICGDLMDRFGYER